MCYYVLIMYLSSQKLLRLIVKNCKNGFTLAEVLITLGIIGIVAAMTIPTLMNQTNQLESITALKKANSVLTSALRLNAMDNGGDLANSFTDVSDFKDKLASNLKILKDCNGTGIGTCWPSSTKKLNNSSDIVSAWTTFLNGDPSVILADGSSLHFDYTNGDPNCLSGWSGESLVSDVCMVIMVDVNGLKPPNVLGKDTFRFFVKNNATLVPFGASSTDSMYNPDTDCLPTGTGSGCTAKYILDN